MLKNYLLSALRNLRKTKLFSLVNIFGLAIGTATCLLILHYVSFEKSYDQFHPNADRIYRIRYERDGNDGTSVRFASCCPVAAPRLKARFPEIEKIARIYRTRGAISYGDVNFIEERVYFIESDFLRILNFPAVAGEGFDALDKPNTAMITESTAKKYFGAENALGKTIRFDQKTDYLIVGILADAPLNSHIKFDFLLSYATMVNLYGAELQESWGHTGFFTYALLRENTDAEALPAKITQFIMEEAGEIMDYWGLEILLPMQPLLDIHLTSHFMQEYEANGDRNSVHFLFIIAFFIIIVAWVNYINLSTARAMGRAREVGLRKVVGASRAQLVRQFFIETILVNLLALAIALLLVEIAMPFFSRISGAPLEYRIWKLDWFWKTLTSLFAVGVFGSGLYPVLVLSSFEPIKVLKGKLGNASKGIGLRRALVLFQFGVAIALIAGTLTVYRQLRFMRSRDLGFRMDQVLVLTAPRVQGEGFEERFKLFKEELLTYPGIRDFAFSTEVPGRQILWDAGGIYRIGADPGEGKNYQIIGVDENFIDLYGLQLITGRKFSSQFGNENANVILSRSAIARIGFESPESAIGQQIYFWGDNYTIVGVLEDHHQQSLKMAYEPHIFRYIPQRERGKFSIKLASADIRENIAQIRKSWDVFFPGNAFEFFFLDEYYNQQYRADELFGNVFGIFAALALFVTCLGIFGLSSFTTSQRTKEIGIRKVLGAEVAKLMFLLIKDFLVLIFVANLIVLPPLIFGINRWLNNFAARMEISALTFVAAFLLVTLITLLTVSYQTIQSALANPVKTLRYE